MIDPAPLINAITIDLFKNASSSIISARFHNTIVEIVNQVTISLRDTYHISTVVLSGGVWQNLLLLRKSVQRLRYNGFQVLTHNQVPPNDGGVALGQAMVAYHHFTGNG